MPATVDSLALGMCLTCYRKKRLRRDGVCISCANVAGRTSRADNRIHVVVSLDIDEARRFGFDDMTDVVINLKDDQGREYAGVVRVLGANQRSDGYVPVKHVPVIHDPRPRVLSA